MAVASWSKAARVRWRAGVSVAEFVVVTAQVLSQCVPGGDDPRGPVAFQSAHRSQPRFRRPWSASTGFVRVALDGMQC
jgi:hypothetical protein